MIQVYEFSMRYIFAIRAQLVQYSLCS